MWVHLDFQNSSDVSLLWPRVTLSNNSTTSVRCDLFYVNPYWLPEITLLFLNSETVLWITGSELKLSSTPGPYTRKSQWLITTKAYCSYYASIKGCSLYSGKPGLWYTGKKSGRLYSGPEGSRREANHISCAYSIGWNEPYGQACCQWHRHIGNIGVGRAILLNNTIYDSAKSGIHLLPF